MRNIKICIIGNSVALRIRPNDSYPNNKSYSIILNELLCKAFPDSNIFVRNKSIGATPITEFLSNVDTLINEQPDYYIVNLGVVDSSTREIPLWLYKYVNNPVKSRLNYIISGIYSRVFMKNRQFFVNIRGNKSWITHKDFAKYYDLLLASFIKETNSRIICLPINIANDRIEHQLPGSRKNHNSFNGSIEEIANKHNQLYVKLQDFILNSDYPDGVHFSSAGHFKVASRLMELIVTDLKINNNIFPSENVG
jgi:hypothetical protein